jgi:DNA ligase-1
MNLTMTTDQILNLIDSVAATSSKNDKIAMLKAASSSDLLKRVLKAAYDPTISYGIRAVPERTEEAIGCDTFDDDTWKLIQGMAERKLTGNAMLVAVKSEMHRLSDVSAELLKRILLKDMREAKSNDQVIVIVGCGQHR